MATQERLIIETLFRVPDKQGVDVDFILNPHQREIDARLTGADIIPKARQLGMSTYFLGRYLAACLYKRNTRAVVISHDEQSTQRMLARVHYMLDNIRGPKAVIKNASKNEITFPKTNSVFYIGTAGSKKFGRGDTITHLHCSEVAFWENAKGLMTGLLQAVPIGTGEIAIESTGNGVGNWYHRACMRAKSGGGRFKLHFFNWLQATEYNLPVTEEEEKEILNNLDSVLEEDELVEKHGLTPGQIKFRRMKLDEFDYDVDMFKQEYPITLDECFQATGRSIFRKVNYVELKDKWKQSSEDRRLTVLEGHPVKGEHYLLGADVSAGIGHDACVAQIFSLRNLEQVGEWADTRTAPDDFGVVVARLGTMFNTAFLTVENNNHGIVTLKVIRDTEQYPIGMIYTRPTKARSSDEATRLTSLGARTTSVSKPFSIGKLRRLLATEMTIHSPVLKNQLDSFIETDSGSLQAEDGCFDDYVIAAAMAVLGVERAALASYEPSRDVSTYQDPFSFESIIKELSGRRTAFPIDAQRYIQ